MKNYAFLKVDIMTKDDSVSLPRIEVQIEIADYFSALAIFNLRKKNLVKWRGIYSGQPEKLFTTPT